jgi:molecular chaperone GrpE (heat shock protein)
MVFQLTAQLFGKNKQLKTKLKKGINMTMRSMYHILSHKTIEYESQTRKQRLP